MEERGSNVKQVLLIMIAGVFAGFVTHQLRPVLRRDFKSSWLAIATSVIGTVLLLIFLYPILRAFGMDEDEAALAVVGLLCIATPVGGGVVIGHYFQPDPIMRCPHCTKTL